MKIEENKTFTGERAEYNAWFADYHNCIFEDGESPLKEGKNIKVFDSTFRWKYPLWYVTNAEVKNTLWEETARSGVWYTSNLTIEDSKILAPKQFRKCNGIFIKNTNIEFAQETMWDCNNVKLTNVYIKGDYFGMNSRNIVLNNVTIDGNYCFDGAKNIEAHNCVFNSKDSFWNCENVTIYDSTIIGEYLGWNTKNITFVNCKMESNQGFCYIDKIKLINCDVNNTDLCFELCSNIDADINTRLISIKNPISGIIRCKGYDELILDDNIINRNKTTIEVKENV